MKSLRNLAVCSIACALCTAAPTRGVGPEAAPTPSDPREEVVKKSFAAPAPGQPSAAPAQPQPQPSQDRTDPKWVESMQRLVKDLTDDNLKLRREAMDLRDQRDFYSRKLEESQTLLLKRQQIRGAFNLPPSEPVVPGARRGDGQVPSNWQPFEFNGVTYYTIPLAHQSTPDGPPVRAQGSKPAINLPEAKK